MPTGDRNDPLTSFNFIVDIQGIKAGFSEIGGLSSETDVIEYRNGNEEPRMRMLPAKHKHGKISLKRGFTTTAKEVRDWYKSVAEGRTQRYSGTITLLDEGRKPALVWKFYEAWPSKWAGPAMNAKNNDVAIEELELAVEALELE